MDEYKMKLREALENLDKRLSVLEHSVNDVIIGSLESAANEYADNEAYGVFKGNYGAEIEPLVVPYKKLFGEDYDIERSLYDDLKATEGYGADGFDEAGVMNARIADLKERLNSLKEEEKEVVEQITEEVKKDEKETDEDEALKELKAAFNSSNY